MAKVYCDNCSNFTEYSTHEEIIEKYKKITVNVVENFGICTNCGEKVFVRELEDDNFKRLYDKYRKLKGLISPEAIKAFRENYDLSQREMVALLGWGKMTINRYERGSIPNQSHNDLLRIIMENENVFLQKAAEAREQGLISGNTYNKISDKSTEIIIPLIDLEFTGEKRFNSEKLFTLLSYFAEKCSDLYPTKVNKIMFYTEFKHFQNFGQSIFGLPFIADQFGPAIINNLVYKIISYENPFYECLEDKNGHLRITSKHYDLTIFTEEEQKTINLIESNYLILDYKKLGEMSHEEEAFLKTPIKALISYDHAETIIY